MNISYYNFNKNINKYIDYTFFLFYGPNLSKVTDICNDFESSTLNHDKTFDTKITLDIESLIKKPTVLNDVILNEDIFGNKKILICDLVNPEILLKNFDFKKNLKKKNFKLLIKCNELKKNNKVRRMFESEKSFITVACYEYTFVECENKIKKRFKENNISINNENLNFLANLLIKNNIIFNQELEKIIVYLKFQKTFTNNQIASILTNGSVGFNIEELVYSIISGKLLLFEKLLNIAISNGVKELSIINALSRHFFKLLYAQSYYKKLGSFDDALKQIKPPIFYKMQKEFIFQTKIWPQKKIEFFITKLLSLEFKLKNNANQPHEYFKSLIFSITKTSYFLKAT